MKKSIFIARNIVTAFNIFQGLKKLSSIPRHRSCKSVKILEATTKTNTFMCDEGLRNKNFFFDDFDIKLWQPLLMKMQTKKKSITLPKFSWINKIIIFLEFRREWSTISYSFKLSLSVSFKKILMRVLNEHFDPIL